MLQQLHLRQSPACSRGRQGTASPTQHACASARSSSTRWSKIRCSSHANESSPSAAHADDASMLDGIAELILEGQAARIICLSGAGISVSAGIPDFRSPGTGLFSRMAEYGTLSKPEDAFDIDFFREDPRPFHLLAKELFPGRFSPTPTHYFFRLLSEKGVLLRVYSQNIDSLETRAGLPADALVAAHGNFDAAHCIRCGDMLPISLFKAAIDSGSICKCPGCQGLVKPQITFYGEDLPERFYSSVPQDFPRCDLLIVMGTSLAVYPFASLIHHVRPDVPRLLINREPAGGIGHRPLDTVYLGDCDEAVMRLAERLGWKQELEAMITGG